ncbi:baeRF6 domain-containing protein [Enterococcus sp. N249-2]
MVKIAKSFLSQVTAEGLKGPFVTIMLNTHVGHQNVEKDQIKFKNFAKEAKRRFEKKYPEHDWAPFQKKIDEILADQSFWRSSTTSAAVILTPEEVLIHRLSIRVDDQYYVGETPYLLAIIKNAQFNDPFYLLALNRDSMKVYQVENKVVSEVELPEEAPTTIEKALGEEISGGGDFNYSAQGGANTGGEGVAYHGFSAKDEELEIDHVNYYQAVDTFFRNDFPNDDNLPLYLFALPENQTLFKKNAKTSYFQATPNLATSPAPMSVKEVQGCVDKLVEELTQHQVSTYEKLLDRKFIDQFVDIIPAAKEGRIGQLFIATSNLADGFGEDPDTEYDRRQVLNTLAKDVVDNGGEVSILEQEDAPGGKSLTAILRY